jgi:hypothetical protein
MDKIELINGIIDCYKSARNVRLPNNIVESRLRRGRSHTISGETEDLFAYFISGVIPDLDKIVIDQPVSYRLLDKKKTIYPDISLIKSRKIIGFLDMKMDLGRNRYGIIEHSNRLCEIVNDTRGREVKFQDGITGEVDNVLVADDIIYRVIVVSSKNITQKDLTSQLSDLAEQMDNSKVRWYFLTATAHPNMKDSVKAKSKIQILDDFETLILELKSLESPIKT